MSDSRITEEIITKFLLDTCQLGLRHHIGEHTFLSWVNYGMLRTEYPLFVEFEPLITGSCAEFYIKPMLSCIGDTDVMAFPINMLAIPAGYPPPTEVPDEFDSRVEVYEIVDKVSEYQGLQFPGYVYLRKSCVMTERFNGKFHAVQCKQMYSSHGAFEELDLSRHGPAVVSEFLKRPQVLCGLCFTGSTFTIDKVVCVRCLWWPPQAGDWPLRHRHYGWPDSATLDRVVSNGCDVVFAVHRQCRQHKWMGKHQHRLSFSRAEVVLLNSWMPVQQIVYHVLRVFVKAESLTESADNPGASALSNYHIKTLMLWACELKQRSWWSDNVNVVEICVKLLDSLADWLTDARCQHYFVNESNLFDAVDNSYCATASRLKSVTNAWFAEWFLNVYMTQCVYSCSDDEVSRLFEDVNAELQKAVSAVADFRLRTLPVMIPFYDLMFQCSITFFTSHRPMKIRLFLGLVRQLSKMHQALVVYFTAVTFLHAAYKTMQNSLKDEMLDVLLVALWWKRFGVVRCCLNARHSSVLSLTLAAMLMKVVANNSLSTVQLIEIELSKAYLYRALTLKDCSSNSIYCLANVYLAVLYYTTGQYQRAMDHCTVVTRSHDHSQCRSHVVQGELTPKIDDDVDNILGLAVFYQYIRTGALSNQQRTRRHVSVFTTELFAHYLHVKCQHVTESFIADQTRQYRSCISKRPQVFITDLVLFSSANRTQCYSPKDRLLPAFRGHSKSPMQHQLDTSVLVGLLQKSAVEHLTTYRQLAQVQECRCCSLRPVVVTDFEALYAYKCGEYERCLLLSAENVRTLLDCHPTSLIFIHPEFISLMDDDIVSLAGLTAIVNPSCRKTVIDYQISQLHLSLYLMTQCQVKLRHSVKALALTYDHVKVALRRHVDRYPSCTFDQIVLKFAEHKILRYISADR